MWEFNFLNYASLYMHWHPPSSIESHKNELLLNLGPAKLARPIPPIPSVLRLGCKFKKKEELMHDPLTGQRAY